MRNDDVALIGIGHYDEPSGITRSIQILNDYFTSRAVLIVDNLTPLELTRSAMDTCTYAHVLVDSLLVSSDGQLDTYRKICLLYC